MPRTRFELIGSRNVAALLDAIAFCEGTDNGRQQTFDDGYDVLVGGGLFTDYGAHPNRRVFLPRYNVHSTAAGRYQFLKRTWDEMAGLLGLANFFPMAQDAACVRLLRRIDAYEPAKAGALDVAIARARGTWASLPNSPYGQRTERMDVVANIFAARGGQLGVMA